MILKAQNLYKSYPKPNEVTLLKNISLEVAQGITVAISGPSGVGKSTLLNIFGTLELASKGSLEIAGQKIDHANLASIRNHHIGFIFQSYHLLEEYTALDNVLMPARIAKKNTSKNSPAFQRALMLLEKVGMAHRTHFLTKLLSGGEKQRIAIARALCNDPSLILADEPTGNLDEANAQSIHTLLINCAKEFHKSLIIVTHNQELSTLCDERFVLKNGTLQKVH
ncbi:MAG: ABC transporter ATP-binding protein [Chlamydiota bacterium]